MFRWTTKIIALLVVFMCQYAEAYTRKDLKDVQDIVQRVSYLTEPAATMAVLSDSQSVATLLNAIKDSNRYVNAIVGLALENSDPGTKNLTRFLLFTICDALSNAHIEAKKNRNHGQHALIEVALFFPAWVASMLGVVLRNWIYAASKEAYPSFNEEFNRRSTRVLYHTGIALFAICMVALFDFSGKEELFAKGMILPLMSVCFECAAHLVISHAEDYNEIDENVAISDGRESF